MFIQSFKISSLAIAQIFFLGAMGFFLVKKSILKDEGLDALSRLVIEVTLPLLIFCQLIKDFNFSLYPCWWFFPLLSIIITLAGLILGLIFIVFIRGNQQKLQFLSLVAFQNSGYLPLALIASLLPKEKADIMFVYLFLFLLGFNLLMWSLGVYILTFTKAKRFELGSLFSPPVIAVMISLVFIYFGFNRFVPEAVLRPLKMIGDCTLPLAMFVVGGSLAQIRLKHIDKKAVSLLVLAKLVILPALGLYLIMHCKFGELLGLLILIQLAMPSATSLSVITRHYKKDDFLVSQGIFFSHIASLITLPLFLSLYFMFVVLQ